MILLQFEERVLLKLNLIIWFLEYLGGANAISLSLELILLQIFVKSTFVKWLMSFRCDQITDPTLNPILIIGITASGFGFLFD